ncbi:2-hydroxychromene-2-carboxylate isomerase [Methylobacterium variabile]|jgi:2-hydroxychromene-2-carboxylate isomerase|uniref:2-hydroxychromene-2-carboxylate isomerase n=1 Tax=Methylobacterium variabile TaxID=298794 RepID=A0A0J6SMS0_9HYPH|nr:2-hydroxychromene-2-carboxylate isomerase [Methylobacterium variabile]KMO34947.1 2-hydroxychromene-2-carboxylate isomerase [Methylobacterium variabile]
MPELSCFYSLSSPWAYLGGPKLQDIVRRHRARLVLKPFDFQEVVPRTGGVPIRTRPQPRRDYHAVELARWRDYLGLPLNVTPRHYPMENPAPNWNKHAGWTVIAAQAAGLDAFPLSHAILRALWAEERDIADPAVRRAIADENGFDGAALVAAEGSEPVQAQYRRNGAEAEALGVFGSPTIVLDGELFWGQDRLDFVDRALARRAFAGLS